MSVCEELGHEYRIKQLEKNDAEQDKKLCEHDKQLAKGDKQFAVINTKLTALIWLLSAVCIAVIGAVVKMVMGV